MTGMESESGDYVSVVYNNENLLINSPPTIPDGLIADVNNNSVILNWNPSTDLESLNTNLTYNLRLGTTPGGNEIVSSMANADGTLKIPKQGNVSQNKNWYLKNLPLGTYYWSIQAIDNNFEGSGFAVESSFTITTLSDKEDVDEIYENAGFVKSYPNPFNHATTIKYFLEKDQHVTLFIFDLSGKKIIELVNEFQTKGNKTITWNGTNYFGANVNNGLYFFKFTASNGVIINKIVKLTL